MAYTINDAHLALAYRVGETSVPTATSELARRLDWFKVAIQKASGGTELMWYMQKYATDTTVADQPTYSLPTRWRTFQQLKIDNYKYTQYPQEDIYEKFELPNSPVPIQSIDIEYAFYVWANEYYPIPIPGSAPTSFSVSSLTRSSTTATATTSSAHGLIAGDHATIAGATPSGYNGDQEILTVPSTTTFTFTASSSLTTPATGTITATERNIKQWYWEYPDLPTGTTSSIVVPDEYLDMIVAYAEGRYWSMAHKRGKASDAFMEFETRLNDMRAENTRKKFYAI
jgi:hypothetical protein